MEKKNWSILLGALEAVAIPRHFRLSSENTPSPRGGEGSWGFGFG
jgi:hypothetical protein